MRASKTDREIPKATTTDSSDHLPRHHPNPPIVESTINSIFYFFSVNDVLLIDDDITRRRGTLYRLGKETSNCIVLKQNI